MAAERVLTCNVGRPEAKTVRGYRESGGYEALARALRMQPEEVIEEVKKSGLRGRGGAGFPCGMKWSFVPRNIEKPKYIVCNADESEPGTFKDRLLMEHDPHQLIEGCVIAGWAVGASTTYIYIRGEYTLAARVLEDAIRDAYDSGILGTSVLGSGFRHDMFVHCGAGAYICGEETGLLESLEGKRGQPRVKPPFPAVVGAFGCPTVINNVETLCCAVHILKRGADWFKSIGTDERNTGPKLYAISGHVERPGTYEHPIGVTFQELLDGCGGMYKGRALKAFIPGGASAPMMTAADAGIRMDFDTLAKAGSMLGSAAVIVMDETTCIVRSTLRLAKFFAHESCGQCTPCREGTNWMRLILQRIERGDGSEADLDLLAGVVPNVGGISLCALGDAAQGPVKSMIARFGDEIRDNIRNRRYPLPRQPFFDFGAVA
ncbi:MAG: NADH-quinone oxidoreductase subunit NuoF [Thermoanaerobaculia bacterium]|nr:MAG: NADH-quinone oxidoreductase subunit NuoF [Thermoanaerobaculia bacterium]MBZ0103162.1 NADH-quinone oxidoreductase subunit NuoF [Thermoanaerobaculia bacterium]